MPGIVRLMRHVQSFHYFVEPDLLMEFSISENGGIDGVKGDQTGQESHVRAYYDYPWDGILECINMEGAGKTADTAVDMSETDVPIPEYRVYTAEDGWLEWLHGLSCQDGCGDNFGL